MARYGWNSNSPGLSPFASQANSQEAPHVTDDDFSYITSEDLEHSLQAPARSYNPQVRQPARSQPSDNDILLIKSDNVTYPVHFPMYSIGEGKLLVKDVQDRAGLVMRVSERRSRKIKLYYKGRQLKERDIPIRDYGVKDHSELLAKVPEGKISDDDEDTSSSAEEVVVPDPRDERKPKKKKNKNGKKKRKDHGAPRESGGNLDVPGYPHEDSSRTTPDASRHPSRVPSPAVSSGPAGPIEKLETIRSHFDTELLPLCQDFSAHPPKDPKKCEDEHRKISETIMQQVILKLDEIETGGDVDIRTRRKDLVNYVQDILKKIDAHLPAGVKSGR